LLSLPHCPLFHQEPLIAHDGIETAANYHIVLLFISYCDLLP
jgi:hypothetical protein